MRPDAFTGACLLGTAALPWYALFSGTYGLYFYVLVLVPQAGRMLDGTAGKVVGDVLFVLALLTALPLGLLLLLVMLAGLVWAAFRRPAGGLAGTLVRGGCIASMVFAALYAAVIGAGLISELVQQGTVAVWWSGLVNAAVLSCGLAAT